MKRLRSRINPKKVRYYMCGEYGENTHRPHYHSLLFGYEFPDTEFICNSKSGLPLYGSVLADELWKQGSVWIGECTFESAAYCARYIMKKINGDPAEDHYKSLDWRTGELHTIIPEYTCMSRNKGIGTGWMEKFKTDVYPEDEVVIKGKLMQPPRFYDSFLDDEELEKIKTRRKSRAAARAHDNTPERLAVKEKVAQAKLTKRGL